MHELIRFFKYCTLRYYKNAQIKKNIGGCGNEINSCLFYFLCFTWMN